MESISSRYRQCQIKAAVPWGHHRLIIDRCKGDNVKASFFVRKTIQNNWSRAVLENFLDTDLYERQGKAITNFEYTLPTPQSDLAQEMTKDPYNFDFLTIREDYDDLSNIVINMEAQAKLHIQGQIRNGVYDLVTSEMLLFEVNECPFEEGHTQRYIRQKPSKISKYRAIQQPTMTCRYRVGGSFFILTNFGETIMIILVNCIQSTVRQYMIEGFTTVKDMAQRWNVTTRTVQILCSEGRIKGATKFGDVWAIPVNVEKPTDNRVKSGAYKNWRKKDKKEIE